MKISVIGMGAMGRGVTASLLREGHAPVVWNRSPEPAKAMAKKGATIADDLDQALDADIVLSALYDDDAVRAVLLDSGALERARKDLVHVSLSTISVELSAALTDTHERHGSAFVSMPMFGRPDAAEEGRLHLPVAGRPEDVARIDPIAQCFGTPWPISETPKDANAAKIAGNFMIGCAMDMMAESAALASATGNDPAPFLTMITQTLFAAPIFQSRAEPIIRNDPPDDQAGFDVIIKDLSLAAEQAQAGGVSVPLVETLRDRFDETNQQDLGRETTLGLYKVARAKG